MVAGSYCLCKKSAKAVGEGGDGALHASAVLPGLLMCAVTWGLKGVRVRSEASQRQQDPERSQDLQLLLSSRGGLVGVTTQSVGGRD